LKAYIASADTRVSQPIVTGVGLALGVGAAVGLLDADADGVAVADPLTDGDVVGVHPLSSATASTPRATGVR